MAAVPAVAPQTEPTLADTLARLRAGHLRVTVPRVAIITAMIRNPLPRSIEAIHATMPPGTCDLVTVYRCLDAFEEIGLVRRVFGPSGTALVYLNSTPEHFHVVDKATGGAASISESPADVYLAIQKVEDHLRYLGYRDVSHVIQFFADAPRT